MTIPETDPWDENYLYRQCLDELKEVHAHNTSLQSQFTAALKRIEDLEAALSPFAQFYNPRLPDNLPISQGSSMAKKQLVAADLRRAAELLKDREPK